MVPIMTLAAHRPNADKAFVLKISAPLVPGWRRHCCHCAQIRIQRKVQGDNKANGRVGWTKVSPGLKVTLSQEAVTVITGVKNGQWGEIAHPTDITFRKKKKRIMHQEPLTWRATQQFQKRKKMSSMELKCS